MGAIEKWNNRLDRRCKRIRWALIFVLALAHVALYIWFDEFVSWIDSLGVEIIITRPVSK